MTNHKIGIVIINNQENDLIGIITDGDIEGY